MTDRLKFIKQLGAGIALAGFRNTLFGNENTYTMIDPNDFKGSGAPDDEKYWGKIAKKYYDVASDYINLENGYYGIQPKPVLDAFQKNIQVANKQAARFARKDFPYISSGVKKELAAFLEVSDEEIIITRNATEALNIAIQGYPFLSGDEVLINQLDYFSMIETFRMLETRGKIKVNAFEMPLLPQSDDEIVDIYRKQLTPKTRVLLLTHVSNINGLIIPVAKIAAMAREKGIDTITDSAHALGQVKFSLPALGSDYVGLNLHKWIGNPVGAGVLYVKKERIKQMNPLFGDVNVDASNIGKLSHFGTTPFAVIMTVPDSLAFHRLMGIDRIAQRLHYLKSIWVKELSHEQKVEIVTPADQQLSCAIASFRVKNKKSSEVADSIFKQYRILTVSRALGEEGCIRVTPSLYNSADDMKRLVAAVKML